MRQLNYFRVHATSVVQEDNHGQSHAQDTWQSKDIMIEQERFLEVVNIAIKSLYSQGPRNYDIV